MPGATNSHDNVIHATMYSVIQRVLSASLVHSLYPYWDMVYSFEGKRHDTAA